MKPKREQNRRIEPRKTYPAKKNLTDVFDIPGVALAGIPHIELAGNREAVVDGCKGVVEYDDRTVRLSTGKMVVKLSGRDLNIRVLTHNSAIINGFISSIEFIV
jgi:sporulation protein YqfC